MSVQILKICAVALIAAVSGVVVKQIKNELSFAVKTAGVILIFGVAMTMLAPLLESIEELSDIGGTEYVDIMLRALGIALISQITSGICRDCGDESVAGAVEFTAKLEILILCVPLISMIIEYAKEIVAMG